jgi:hypothetical protein
MIVSYSTALEMRVCCSPGRRGGAGAVSEGEGDVTAGLSRAGRERTGLHALDGGGVAGSGIEVVARGGFVDGVDGGVSGVDVGMVSSSLEFIFRGLLLYILGNPKVQEIAWSKCW